MSFENTSHLVHSFDLHNQLPFQPADRFAVQLPVESRCKELELLPGFRSRCSVSSVHATNTFRRLTPASPVQEPHVACKHYRPLSSPGARCFPEGAQTLLSSWCAFRALWLSLRLMFERADYEGE